MIYMLQPKKMSFYKRLNPQVVQVNNEFVVMPAEMQDWGLPKKEFFADIHYKQNRYCVWGFLNKITHLYFFPRSSNKKKEKFYDIIKSALEVFIRGMQQA